MGLMICLLRNTISDYSQNIISSSGVKSDLTRDDVLKIVRDSVPQQADHQEKDAQMKSVVEEVQNIIGQIREHGILFGELGEKVREIQRNDTNDRFGIQLAKAVSRVEGIERQNINQPSKKLQPQTGAVSEEVNKRLIKLETSVGVIDKLEKEK